MRILEDLGDRFCCALLIAAVTLAFVLGVAYVTDLVIWPN